MIMFFYLLGLSRRGSATVLNTHMHVSRSRQELIHVFLRKNRKMSLYFIKLLVSAQYLQNPVWTTEWVEQNIYGKKILGNLEHGNLWMSRLISRVINYGNCGKYNFVLKKEQVLNFWFELWNLTFSLAPLPDANSISRWQ